MITHAGVVQRLVCEFSKLEIAVRFCAPAPVMQTLRQQSCHIKIWHDFYFVRIAERNIP